VVGQKEVEKRVTGEGSSKNGRESSQTGDAGSAGRRESARRNTGRKERDGAGTAGSSGVDSSGGPDAANPVGAGGVTWMAGISGWSKVDVETRFPSLPPSIAGGVVVIRSKDV
jgi:hypothetical protein